MLTRTTDPASRQEWQAAIDWLTAQLTRLRTHQ
jgi:hypothetical protein